MVIARAVKMLVKVWDLRSYILKEWVLIKLYRKSTGFHKWHQESIGSRKFRPKSIGCHKSDPKLRVLIVAPFPFALLFMALLCQLALSNLSTQNGVVLKEIKAPLIVTKCPAFYGTAETQPPRPQEPSTGHCHESH